MLCNTAEAFKVVGLNADRKPVFNDGVTLSNIYIIFNDGEANGSNGKTANSNATLYYDVNISQPKAYMFSKGDKITVDGLAYTVERISPYYNANGLQHYEVSLIG